MPPRHVSALPLAADEVVIFQIRQSPLLLALQLSGLVILALILIFVLRNLGLPDPPLIGSLGVTELLTLTIALAIGLVVLVRILDYRSTVYTLTNRRVQHDFGILQHSSYAVPLSQIETLDIVQNILSRLLGFGDLVIRSTSISLELIYFRAIRTPAGRRQQIEDQLP